MVDIAFDTRETASRSSPTPVSTEAITAAMRRAISQGVATEADPAAIETRSTVRFYAGSFAAVAAQTASTVGLLTLFQG